MLIFDKMMVEKAMKLPLRQTIWRLSLSVLGLCTILCSGCLPSNNYPVISSLGTEKDWVLTSGSCRIECVASDADGDSLNYIWSAAAGTFSGAGPVVTWIAPHMPGTYTVTVEVTDGRGGEAVKQLTIDVLVNHRPVIESLVANPSVVNQSETTTIECIASDPDGDKLSYQWKTTGGSISGEGAAVTWTAPITCGSYVVTVTVADGKGG
ncbi:Ig-like domain-containing protein, partial [Chloroflexota bacterium]